MTGFTVRQLEVILNRQIWVLTGLFYPNLLRFTQLEGEQQNFIESALSKRLHESEGADAYKAVVEM